MTRSDSERITALEVRVEALTKSLEKQNDLIEEVHEALMKAQGAKWAIGSLLFVAGALGGLAAKLIPLLRT